MMTTQKAVIARAKMCETDLDRVTMNGYPYFLYKYSINAQARRYNDM